MSGERHSHRGHGDDGAAVQRVHKVGIRHFLGVDGVRHSFRHIAVKRRGGRRRHRRALRVLACNVYVAEEKRMAHR